MTDAPSCIEVPRVPCGNASTPRCGHLDVSDRTWFSCNAELYVEFVLIMGLFAFGAWWHGRGGALPQASDARLSCGTLSAVALLGLFLLAFVAFVASFGVAYAGNMLTTTLALLVATFLTFRTTSRAFDDAGYGAFAQSAEILYVASFLSVVPYCVILVDNRVFTEETNVVEAIDSVPAASSLLYGVVPLSLLVWARSRAPRDVQNYANGAAAVALVTVAVAGTFFDLVGAIGEGVEATLTMSLRAGFLCTASSFLLQQPVGSAFGRGRRASAASVLLAAWLFAVADNFVVGGVDVVRILTSAATIALLVRRRLQASPDSVVVGTATLTSVILAMRFVFELSNEYFSGPFTILVAALVGGAVLYAVQFAPER